ncbi:DUF2087 domain-containing protein [Pseudodesulfovibrio sediminis]|uniref:DUF2087 domain-containing protein n=1 Tax=Pseudodesulfovibrio sediminis TaxID=2810563 RepID=A0ABN6EWQ0_9BACT|nr:DUF2087 domain-containing protein [Pseudodesulfovibrio sediminis]BCS89571.1 hypothetical protein PSDVSF_28130 [Pseudodesulfovibrio sediminis]
MSKSPMPLYVGDISALARNVRGRLQDSETIPSHVEMLNLLVKASGYRNFQHFKAQFEARKGLDLPKPHGAEINFKRVKRVLRLFDADGYLTHWPKKYSERVICLWVMWSRISARKTYTECEISELLEQQHLFEDHALLRRQLVDLKLMNRTPDGREYQRIEAQPPAEALEVLARMR